ncbi:Trp biosynthesis-associated membrane protein [Nocardioides sp. R-C-SC26]|uniref:Trp biosynthesis-associated membrane protein n=1 Tax=Nocardioides sp. R-C-SC26 TaxID=2870414 RepID=UPI001E3DEF9F|nr:Trp biosynthesis-associated membrane protein [Nocardioides sp. R-C-SC26]
MTDPDAAGTDEPAAMHLRGPRFGPTVLLGVIGGGAAAVAGNQDWVRVAGGGGRADAAYASAVGLTTQGSAPPVTALALVCLAAWGVLLVTRGIARRLIAWLGVVAAGGLVAVAAVAWQRTPGLVGDDIRGLAVDLDRTWWAHLGVAMSLAALVAAIGAARGVRRWPEMGHRYDAPSAAGSTPPAASEDGAGFSHLELWRSLDEGRDPTDPDGSGR